MAEIQSHGDLSSSHRISYACLTAVYRGFAMADDAAGVSTPYGGTYKRPLRTRTRSGCLPCRSRKRKCDGARPRCRNCEFRGDGCAWGVKVSFHPSRALTLSAEDEASLLDVEQQRRADNTEQADADEPHQFVDDTNDIVEFFEGDYVTPSSPISDVDDPVVTHEAESQTDAESHTIPFVESTTPDDQNLDQGSWKAAEEAPGLTAHAQQQILPLITADTGAHQAPALHAETVVSYTAPFSLGQAIFSDAAPLPDLDLPVSKTEQARLVTAYLRETGTWCETTDSEKHFTVKSIHSMMESRAFVAAAQALSSRQVDTLRGRERQTALELYQYTIRLLIYQDPSEATPPSWRHVRSCVYTR
ncbi:hypothetical protein K456DRAFT_619546 [Colletotrichum gloeosporioides 23]|nr:hypothetical protein K456DRAFT_619546 [Colletotrichum gloeosporioides 23]